MMASIVLDVVDHFQDSMVTSGLDSVIMKQQTRENLS